MAPAHPSWLHRRAAAVLAVLTALTASLVLPAEAAPPMRDSQSGVSVDCALDEVYLGAFVSTGGEFTFLDVFVDVGGTFLYGGTDDVVVDGDTVTGTVELVDEETWEVVGEVTVDATVVASGPTETFSDRFRYGNVLERFEDSFTGATTTGTITLSGPVSTTIDLDQCSGALYEFSFFVTQPATFVDQIDDRFLSCRVSGPDVYGELYAGEFEGDTFVDLFLDRFDDGFVFGFADDPVFDDTTLAATLELFDDETGEPAGTATVAAELTSLGTVVDEVRTPTEGVKVTIEQFAVDGTLTVGEDVYELVDCDAEDVEGRVRFTDPPRRVRPVANDTPGTAVALPVPGSASADTRGAVEAPEAPCTATFEFEDEFGDIVVEEFDLPITNTVWYSFTGTGGPVRIDSAGSAIDTIVGVYDSTLDQLECVDDVFEEPEFFSLQAAVTVDTVVGETYLVQVGGFGGDAGPVTVTLD